MSRQELGRDVWYDGGLKGYAMLDVTHSVPAISPLVIDGTELLPKEEYHVSIAKLRALARGDAAKEAELVTFLQEYFAEQDHEFRWAGLTGDYYVCRKPNQAGETQMTLIGSVEIVGLRALERAMRDRFDPAIRLSQPHVTLLKSTNSPYGIGINSADDLASLCTPIELQ
ncbi:hypothetical protein IPM09_04230 [Candidatus Saccharibacteria bacterium]|nr:MAG: hypothetical protein IPM09_04230 [Candidatus Saccharibacteria bacterium]